MDNVSIVAVTQNAVVDPSFELPAQTGGSSAFTYDPTGTAWTFAGNSGIQANGSSWGAANAPDGTQTAFLEGNSSGGGSISQSVTFDAGTYAIQFAAAQQPGGGTQPLAISVDGTQVGDIITPTSTSFAQYTTAHFTVSAGVHTISFSTTDNNDGDRTTFLDDVVLKAIGTVPPTLAISGAAITNEGAAYPLNLSATETDGATITGWTINWGDGTTPQPISGNPESINHTYASGAPNTYTITATATDQDGTYSANSQIVAVAQDPFSDPGFELPAQTAGGATYNPTGSAWTFAGNSGIQANGSGWGAAVAPEGTQTAFLQASSGTGGSISQSVTLAAGTYAVQFDAAQRGGAAQSLAIGVDGTQAGPVITPTSSSFAQYTTASFTVTTGVHTITFSTASNNGDRTAFLDDVSIVAVTQNAFVDPSFELPAQTGGSSAFTYDPTGTAWTFAGNSGIQANGSSWGAANAPDGTQTAFLEGNSSGGGSISQSVTFDAGTYAIQFAAAQQPGGGTQPLAISVDGTQVGDIITPASTSFAQYTTAHFTVSAGVHTITFSTTDNNNGDQSSFLDNVVLKAIGTVPPTLAISGAATTNEGAAYALNLSATETDGATITGWTINWGDGTTPQPISGNPESINHTYTSGAPNTYTITATATDQDGTYAANSQIVAVAQDPFSDPGFELPAQTSGGATYNPTGTAWTFVGNSGIQANGSGWGAAVAPEGTQTAFLQASSGTGGSISQSVTLAAGTYAIQFEAAQRGGEVQPLAVSVDGTQVGDVITPTSSSFAQYTTANFIVSAGVHTITFSTTDNNDGDRTSFLDDVALTAVAIVPPTLSISGAATANQGLSYPLSLSATETDGDTISGWTINWGDGTTPQAVSGNPSSVNHVYDHGTNAGSNNYTITATATDLNGTYSANSQSVTVNSVAPTLSISGAASANQGLSYPLSLSATETDGDTVTGWTVNWGDGTTPQAVSGNPSSVNHVYDHGTNAGSNNYTITATATDQDGTYAANSQGVTVTSVAPTLSISGAATANPGASYPLSLSSTETDGDTITGWTINWGDGTTPQAVSGNPSSVNHVYGQGTNAGLNTYTITATATDQDGTYSANSQGVALAQTSFFDPGFESPAQTDSAYTYDPSGTAWTFTGYSGIQANGSAWGAANAPEGTQTAFLQAYSSEGGSISQSVALQRRHLRHSIRSGPAWR